MSSLEALLKKIHAIPEPRPQPIFDVDAASADLDALVNRVDTRQWLAEEIPKTREFIRAVAAELRAIDHVLTCERCLIEMQLDVERYYGTRTFWWLNYNNLDAPLEWEENDVQPDDIDDDERPYFEMFNAMPRRSNYEIGYYGNDGAEDTIRFIKDRDKWARGISAFQFEKAKEYMRLLRNWDFKPETKEKAWSLLHWLIHASAPP